MARPRTLPDAEVYAAVLRLIAEGGERAAVVGAVSRATGLAPPSLVQRYGSVEAMVKAALMADWDAAEARLAAAAAAEGLAAFLKALAGDGGLPEAARLALALRDGDLKARAEAWRLKVEAALASRLGGGAKARDTAGLIFAAWAGGAVWQEIGGRPFRAKDLAKRLG